MKICANCHEKIGLLSKGILISEDENFKDENIYVCSDKCKKDLMKKAEKQFEKNREYYKKTGKEFVCKSCGYLWISRKSFGVPAICPKCKSENIIKYAHTREWEENYIKQKKQHIKEILAYHNFMAKNK